MGDNVAEPVEAVRRCGGSVVNEEGTRREREGKHRNEQDEQDEHKKAAGFPRRLFCVSGHRKVDRGELRVRRTADGTRRLPWS